MESKFIKSSYSPRSKCRICVMCRHINKRVEVKHSSFSSPKITFSEEEWNAFVKGVKAGEFDL